MTYGNRPITVFMLPATEDVIVHHPEQSVLKCPYYLDIGALCYLKRSNERMAVGLGRKVDVNSLDNARAETIRKITNTILQQSAARELAVQTIAQRYTVFIKFLDWCDSNEHWSALAGVAAGRSALRGYVAHLRHLFEVNRIAMGTATGNQSNLIIVLNQYFDIPNIALGINLIKYDRNLISNTLVPTQDKFEKFMSINLAVFDGIFDLVIEKKEFPYAVKMPQFVGYTNNQMWIFPSKNKWARHPESIIGENYKAYDYENGRIKGLDEVFQFYSSKDSAIGAIKRTLAVISSVNGDMRAPSRFQFASMANSIFIRLFEAITGGNRADIERIEWTEELALQIANPDTKRQGIRSIKVRAANREVFYQIGVIYMPLLRKFARLREWLIDGDSCDRMFFHFNAPGGRGATGPATLSPNNINKLIRSFLTIYPSFKKINLGNRGTRASKQDDVIRNHDPVIGAKIMQHSLPTALRSYSNGSAELARDEIGDFLQRVHSVVEKGRDTKIEEERAAGSCISKNQPRSIVLDPPVKPDCRSPEGCLFCDKYRAHTDEKDVRKLLSAKFVVGQTSQLAASAEEYDRVFGATITRIDEILLEIRAVNDAMSAVIDRISIEVLKDGLDDYWSLKMSELYELGIL